jgi:hypothetical protein
VLQLKKLYCHLNPVLDRVGLRLPMQDFKNVLVSKNAFDQLICKDFLVLINVYSGRKSSDLNLISCNILQKDISQVKSRNHILKGKLIEEY